MTRLMLLPVLALMLTACIPPPATAPSPAPATVMILPSPTVTVAHACVYRDNGALPDPACTPGAVNPGVTQSNLGATICRSGYSASVRPPVSFTNALKLKQMAEYGVSDRSPRDFEEDHLVSLELGGSPDDPHNLWPEPGASPNPKDAVENSLHEKVCHGLLSLIEAQQRIMTDWQTADR